MDVRALLAKAYAAALNDDDVATPEEVTGYFVLLVQDEEQAEIRARLDKTYSEWNLNLVAAPTRFGDASRIKRFQDDAAASHFARCEEKIAQVGEWISYAEVGIKTAISLYSGNPAGLGAALLPLVMQVVDVINNPDTPAPKTPYEVKPPQDVLEQVAILKTIRAPQEAAVNIVKLAQSKSTPKASVPKLNEVAAKVARLGSVSPDDIAAVEHAVHKPHHTPADEPPPGHTDTTQHKPTHHG